MTALRMVRTAGLEPALLVTGNRFSYHFDLRRRPPQMWRNVRGLDHPFAMAPLEPKAPPVWPLHLPASAGLARDWPRQRRSPNLSGSAPAVSRRALQLKSAASTDFATSASRTRLCHMRRPRERGDAQVCTPLLPPGGGCRHRARKPSGPSHLRGAQRRTSKGFSGNRLVASLCSQ